MLCCYATSYSDHQTFTKKMICVVPENNKIISIQPLPPLMEWISNSRGWEGGGAVRIFHINSVRGVGVGWTFSGVTKTLILPRSVETKKCFCV